MLKSIEQQIWQQASLLSDKIAVISGKKSASYKELCQRILGARNFFQDTLSLNVGDVVIIAAGKQIEFIYAYFGAHLAGIKVVPIDAATNPTRLSFIIKQTKASLLVGFDNCNEDIAKVSLKDFAEVSAPFVVPKFSDIDSVSDILFTTGTTGKPKGVPLTFANEAAAARNINEFIGNTQDDIELLALPVSHSFGLGRVRCCLSKGATLILLGSFANVKKLYRTMEEYHVTGFTMVPASWRYLKKLTCEKLGEYKDQLKYIEMGSAFFSKDEKKELSDLLPHTRVCMHYGLTEASRSAFMEFHADAAHLDSVGKASPNTDIKVMDENGKECAFNQEGEICVKGEHVTKGYLDLPIKDSFFGDYFRTGDWGYKTEEGYIYLISRKKELINVGGKKVSPIEVEEQLLKIDGVEDCACIGVPDEEGVLGEVVKAFIVKAKNCDLTFDGIKNQLSGRLESYKMPVHYEWIDAIPKTQNGKIQRGLLK
mgnify:FL=1